MDELTRTRSPDQVAARWPALIAALAAAGLYAALPGYLAIGPNWLPAIIVAIPSIVAAIAHRRGWRRANITLGYAISFVLTGLLLWSVGVLVRGLVLHAEPPVEL